MLNYLKKHRLLLLLILVNATFVLLYWRFVSGRAVYLYSDIGSDSIAMSYPVLALVSRMLRTGAVSTYSVQMGLGADLAATLLQFVNPVRLLMVIFGEKHLAFGIFLSTWVQVNLTAVFSYLFLRKLTDDGFGSLIGSLSWTFSSYVVVWGQNFTFLTCMMMFSMAMCFLQYYLTDGKRRVYLLFVPVCALFLFSNYYFLYMTGVFAALYIIIYMAAKREKPVRILRKLAGTLLMACLSVLMAGAALVPILNGLFSSTRTSAVGTPLLSLVKLYSFPYFLTFGSRLFSANLFGVGSWYRGAVNYYEVALLSTSFLFFFAVVYLILRKKSRKLTLLLVILSALMLSTPLVSHLLTLNLAAQRWSFMICFLEAVAIAFFVKSIRSESADEAAYRKTLVAAPVFCILNLGCVLFIAWCRLISLNRKALLVTLFFLAAYAVLFFLFRKKRAGRAFPLLLALLAVVELAAVNYQSVNTRIYLTREEYDYGYYNDGTQTAAAQLQTEDPALYRIYDSRHDDAASIGVIQDSQTLYANEGMVNDYAGTSFYNSTISSSLIGYGKSQGRYVVSSNFFFGDYRRYYLYTFLGGRYLISDPDDPSTSGIESGAFERLDDIDGKAVFRNTSALPFGYLYTREIPDGGLPEEPFDLSRVETQGFFYTNGRDAGSLSLPAAEAPAASRKVNLSEFLVSSNDCTYDNEGRSVTIRASGGDPYVVAQIPKAGEGEVRFLRLRSGLNAENGRERYLLFLTSDAYPNFGLDYMYTVNFTETYPENTVLLPSDVTGLRFDVEDGLAESLLTEAVIETVPAGEDFAALAASDVTGARFDGNTYTASVSCPESEGMFCVPVPWSANWTASVNGASSPVENINGGLIGIPVGQGTSDVVLTYRTPNLDKGLIVSIAGAALFLLIYFLGWQKDRRAKVR